MNDTMAEVLPTLPDDLRPSARVLWERSRAVTDEVTETLLLSYKILREIPGRPQLLESGARELDSRVASSLAAARADIDAAYPQLANSWQGGGAEAFCDYIPRLSQAIQQAQDSALHTVEAVATFRASLVALWSKVIEKTQQTGGEVLTAVAAAGEFPIMAVNPVIQIIERFSRFVEQLAESLMRLTSEEHPAGGVLARTARTGPLQADNGSGLRLPTPSQAATTGAGWSPAHQTVALDAQALAQMTAALDSSSEHWSKAATESNDIADNQLTPEAFGLAGSHFYGDVHKVIARDRELYGAADSQVAQLAQALRGIGAAYAEADDEVAEELRRDLDDR